MIFWIAHDRHLASERSTKGYQVTQHTTPICKNGTVTIRVNGEEKNILLNRIHLEEDAGKSIHDADENFTCIDFNRAGVPLLEIVSEPDMYSAEEAFAYVTEIRKMVRYLQFVMAIWKKEVCAAMPIFL